MGGDQEIEQADGLATAFQVGASELLGAIRKVDIVRADAARECAYRLSSICERKRRAADALSYNARVQA